MDTSECILQISNAIDDGIFIKLTLSKSADRSADLKNIYIRKVQLKNNDILSFTLHHASNDLTKNFSVSEGLKKIKSWLEKTFLIGTLFTTQSDITFKKSKNGWRMISREPTLQITGEESHDRKKNNRITLDRPFLYHLGITDQKHNLIPKMADKYRQINKYLEIVEGFVANQAFNNPIHIVDMGSGKGYLTFALYDFITHDMDLEAMIFGIEVLEDLVQFCNDKAELCGFDQLFFQSSTIQEFKFPSVDILIALHACDTATDDAIAFGMSSGASVIITAPCCHKQIRQQVKGKKITNPLLMHGIFKDRQYEMVTDTIRALLMEKHKYSTKIFEFVSNEHTRKNVMMVGAKSNHSVDVESIDSEIKSMKEDFQIDFHYLEKVLNSQEK